MSACPIEVSKRSSTHRAPTGLTSTEDSMLYSTASTPPIGQPTSRKPPLVFCWTCSAGLVKTLRAANFQPAMRDRSA